MPPAPPKRRNRVLAPISPRIRNAVRLMVWEGITAAEAAARIGIKPEALAQSLGVPQVKALLVDELDVLKESKRPRSIHRIDQLAERAESEAVRLNANKYLESKGSSDRGPVVNVQINNQQPGYVIAVDPRFANVPELEQQPTRLMTPPAKPLK